MFLSNFRKVRRVHDEQTWTKNWSLQHRTHNVNHGQHGTTVDSSATLWIPNWHSRWSNNKSWSMVSKAADKSSKHRAVHCLVQITCCYTPLLLPSSLWYGTDGMLTVSVATGYCCPRKPVTTTGTAHVITVTLNWSLSDLHYMDHIKNFLAKMFDCWLSCMICSILFIIWCLHKHPNNHTWIKLPESGLPTPRPTLPTFCAWFAVKFVTTEKCQGQENINETLNVTSEKQNTVKLMNYFEVDEAREQNTIRGSE